VTGINRRQFSLLLAAGLSSPALLAQSGTPHSQPLLASAATNKQGQHSLKLVAADGELLLDHPLPARAHHIALHPQQPWLAAIARRPGTYIEVIDYQRQRLVKRLQSPAGRHFYGHAIFSEDGRYLISCENNLPDGQGRITVRDLQQDFAQVADYPSYGIGPHELKLLSDQQTLVVANGGILTHPEQGRDKLNLDNMQPSLAYIDLASGTLQEQVSPPTEMHQLSIRHLDVNADDTVMIALQYQGARHHDVPLIAAHQRGEPLALLRAPDEINRAMKLYCGSARFDHSGQYAAISAPKGDLVTFWDAKSREYLGKCKVRDGCGLAATEEAGGFLISSGRGRLYHYQVQTGEKRRLPLNPAIKTRWDNHMISV